MGVFDAKKISTQQHLDVEDIRDNLVVLKNGRVAVIIETTSLNFDLLDGKEQDARIGSFAAFLNSITFPIQIVIRTQRTDIAKYLKLLDKYKQKTTSDAIVNQVSIYQEFINNLTQSTQVLDKRFYAVIPTNKLPIVTTGWLKQLLGKQKRIVNVSELLVKAKEELYPKRDHILKQFTNLGIAARQLQNDELIKLYYSMYEPDRSGMEILNIREEDVERGIIG
ncbi:hypothetical protein KC669_00780 [Candidatus Dojkabacteria bacterium]|uniref:Uncharacterized protein n=1 Tax=Candidatus Dojkabacteria bacterium TaxID=2099670 RepID=A0A955RL26_9BACT|nr:hypothetical protein [Candidatus Dojkabacteria bacterium]